MVDATWIVSIYALVCMLILLKVEGGFVNITYVESAVEKGAVCLDGSAPAYFLATGFDSGVNSWLVHIEGGGWCNNVESCLARKDTNLGSSNHMEQQHFFSAILSDDQSSNPYFYNWNRVFVRYCDGSSFTGDIEEVDPATNIYIRGARVWRAIMDDLLAKGMSNAENALLSGGSAGGLATILHCDSFRSLLHEGARVKCLSDAGFFVNVKDVTGTEYIKDFFNGVVTTHGSAKNLPSSCTSKMEASMCFFPQYTAPLIRTPLFILNPAYDAWQIRNILVPETADPNGSWTDCKQDIQKCSQSQLQTIQDFRKEFLSALASLGNSPSTGMFINSCYSHSQAETPETWFGANSPVLENTPIAVAVGNWFYDQSSFQQIDCPYPCNPSCYKSSP